MSRSCHNATSSSAGITLARSTRASPQSCSHFTGLRLCGIALEPFCAPARNGSCTSASSVCCNRRISSAHASMPAPSDAHAYSSSAWRSRAITCVAGTGVSPRCSHTYASTSGSICEYVPTAPDSLPTAIASRARATHAVTPHLERPERELGPEVVGSAWTPCVRPTIGVPRCSRARAAMAASSSSTAVNRRSHARTRVTDRAVSTTSLEVRPWHPGPVGEADPLLDDVDEGRDIVLGGPLPLLDGGDVEAAALPDRRGCLGRDHAQLGLGLDGQQLDLEPGGVAGLVGEEIRHGCQGVSGDQGRVPPCRHCTCGTDVPRGRHEGAGACTRSNRRRPCKRARSTSRRVPSANVRIVATGTAPCVWCRPRADASPPAASSARSPPGCARRAAVAPTSPA